MPTRKATPDVSSHKKSYVNDDDDSEPAVPFKVPRRFVGKPFHYHQELTIRIDSLTNMGWGVGRIKLEENHEKDTDDHVKEDRLWVVMVPHVVVGELVKVRIFRNQRNYSEADLIEVIEPSPHRCEPKCSLAGICGGCQYQHMSIEAQRDWKTKHVMEVLLQLKIKGYEEGTDALEVLPTMGTDHVYEYRSKITPHYDSPKEIIIGLDDNKYEIGPIGFQQASNRNLVDVLDCPIATPAINQQYKEFREVLHEQAREGLLFRKRKKSKRGSRGGGSISGATLLFRQADDDPVTGEPVVVTDPNKYMITTVKDLKFRYLAGNFFQNNNYVLPLLVEEVIKASTRHVILEDGTTISPSYLIDCYCGSGLFALHTSSYFDLCVGIEVNDRAVEEAAVNAALNNIENCQFVAASAEAIFTSPPNITVQGHEDTKVEDFPRKSTVVILDPPRKGCSTEFLDQLYEYSPQRIVYMSCGPATQARDAKGIVEVGGYDIVFVQPFDLFPQTKHIECLIVFEKKR